MIIDLEDDAEVASAHTLVSPSAPNYDDSDTTSSTSPTRIPPLIAPICFAFLVVSIPPFFLAIINLPISLISTLPTIVAFTVSLALHSSAIYTYWSQATQASSLSQWPLRGFTKTDAITFITLLQGMWIASAVSNAFVFVDGQRRLNCFCNLPSNTGLFDNWSNDVCVRRLSVFFILSTSLSSIAVILLGTLSWMLFRMSHEPSSSPSLPSNDASGRDTYTYFIVPLTFASLGIETVPFMIGMMSFKSPSIYPYAVSTTIAFIITLHAQVALLLAWYKNYRNNKSMLEMLTPSPGSWLRASFTFLLLPPWIVSTVTGAGIFFGGSHGSSNFLDFPCADVQEKIPGYVCPKLYLEALTVVTSIEVLVLVGILGITLRHLGCRWYKERRAPTSVAVSITLRDNVSRKQTSSGGSAGSSEVA